MIPQDVFFGFMMVTNLMIMFGAVFGLRILLKRER